MSHRLDQLPPRVNVVLSRHENHTGLLTGCLRHDNHRIGRSLSGVRLLDPIFEQIIVDASFSSKRCVSSQTLS